MARIFPHIQKAQIKAGTLTATFDLSNGEGLPTNIHVNLKVSAMSASETLDITARMPGATDGTYVTAVVVTQIDINAAASSVIRSDLSAAAPADQLLFTATNIASAETIDITLITW